MKQLPIALKAYIVKNLIEGHILYYPTSLVLTNWWSFGLLTGFCLVTQILTGVWLALYYSPDADYSFITLQHIMREVNYGWLVRYMHMNGASMCFIIVYLHVVKAFYLKSFLSKPKTWRSGIVLLLLFMASAFMGYNLPWSQMGYWGAVVITSLLTSIPYIGQDITSWLWGHYAVSNFTLKRFFVLHFILPFILLASITIHLAFLHEKGSSTPLQTIFTQYISFGPYFYLKDFFGISLFVLVFYYFIFINPYGLNHVDSFVMANFMVTPHHIVPEWYFLPYYAMLRSFPSKLYGFSVLVLSILILLVISKFSKSLLQIKENKLGSIVLMKEHIGTNFFYNSLISVLGFAPLYLQSHFICFWYFIVNFVILGWIGTQPVISPYTIIGVISTAVYFFILTWWTDFYSFISTNFFLVVLNDSSKRELFLKFQKFWSKKIMRWVAFIPVYYFILNLYFVVFIEFFIAFVVAFDNLLIEIFESGLRWLQRAPFVLRFWKRNYRLISFFAVGRHKLTFFHIKQVFVENKKSIYLSALVLYPRLRALVMEALHLSWTRKSIILITTLQVLKILKVMILFLTKLVPLLLAVAYFTLAERKILAKVQRREGPAVTGIWGFLQPLVDGIKLFLKELIYPARSNFWLFWGAPIFVISFSMANWALIAFGWSPPICDANMGMLLFFAVASLNTYSLIVAAWSSNSKFSLFGCLRAVSQLLSYELLLGFVTLLIAFLSGSFNITDIVVAQSATFFLFKAWPLALVFFVLVLIETNRIPFDLPEAESELVSGYHTEYSAVLFAFFLVAEYSNILLMSAMWVIMFWGGWLPPMQEFVELGLRPEYIFSCKVILIAFLVIFTRALLPRYRFDQLVSISWKILLPILTVLGMCFFVYHMYYDIIPVHPYLTETWVSSLTSGDGVPEPLNSDPVATEGDL